jgi:hypothetical protein
MNQNEESMNRSHRSMGQTRGSISQYESSMNQAHFYEPNRGSMSQTGHAMSQTTI